MSLDVTLSEKRVVNVFEYNITHNLTAMAAAAGIYDCIWHPEYVDADSLIEPLTNGLELLRSDPERFRKYDAENGWGTYEQFVEFVEAYLNACKESPDATIGVCR
jgi:hypothetical protein